MELKGEQRVEASREKVWQALNDPKVLKACIPGCEELNQVGEHGFDAVVVAKIGPVKAKFKGNVELSNINPPESYTISGEGKGGAAGMAKGGADVFLEADGDATILKYTVKADVGGKLAQIGSRLIQSTANKYARDFFAKFGGIVTGAIPLDDEAVAAPVAATAALAAAARPPASPAGAAGDSGANAAHVRHLNWVLLAIIVGLLVYILK
jgi:uncharacterized protein